MQIGFPPSSEELGGFVWGRRGTVGIRDLELPSHLLSEGLPETFRIVTQRGFHG